MNRFRHFVVTWAAGFIAAMACVTVMDGLALPQVIVAAAIFNVIAVLLAVLRDG